MRHLLLSTTACAAIMIATGSAQADMAAAEKFLAEEINGLSVLSEEEQKAEMEFFINAAKPFDPSMFDVFPEDWLAQAPGVRVTSALIRVETRTNEAEMREKIDAWFVPESVAATYVLGRDAVLAADFRIDEGGHTRCAVFAAEGCSPRRIGRIVQRLCEIETYKQMSMLGLARARALQGRLGGIERLERGLEKGRRALAARVEQHRIGKNGSGLSSIGTSIRSSRME